MTTRSVPLALAAETATARLDGVFRGNPDLGRLWRTAAAWTESASSVGLDDIRLNEASIVMRRVSGTNDGTDARGAEMASRLLVMMARPPSLFDDPVTTMRRVDRAGSPIGETRDETDIMSDSEILDLVDDLQGWSVCPVLCGVRAASLHALRTRRSAPVSERLLFMLAENDARREGDRIRRRNDEELDVFAPAEASWTATPATALTRGGFRVWSPISGIETILEAVTRQSQRDLGEVGKLRHELGRLDDIRDNARGRSRLADLVELVRENPVITSSMVMDRIGVTRKTSLSLISEMEGQGALVNFTSRRTARFWATPTLAGRLMIGTQKYKPGRERPEAHETGDRSWDDGPAQSSRFRDDFDEEKLTRILDDLEQAMKGIDQVTKNMGRPDGLN